MSNKLFNLLTAKNKINRIVNKKFFSTSNSCFNNTEPKSETLNNNYNNNEKKPLSELVKLKKPTDYAEYTQPGSLYDPPYINKEKPFPNYATLNINLYSYDYVGIDYFYKYVESICNYLKINVKEAYAMPAKTYTIKSYKPYSTILDKEYKLCKYHRVIRVEELKSTLAPILYETIQLNLPEGVQMTVTEPNEEEDEFRYIPDIEVQELKKTLEEKFSSKK